MSSGLHRVELTGIYLPEVLLLHAGQNQAEAEARVELHGLGVLCGGRTRQTGLERRQDLDQGVLLAHQQHWDQQRQSQTGAGTGDGTRRVLARVRALGGKSRTGCRYLGSYEYLFSVLFNPTLLWVGD